MRIDERTLSEQASATAGRAAESQRIQVDTSTFASPSNTTTGDHVDLSSLTGRISQSMQMLASQSAQKVSRLQQQFQAGRYQPDPDRLSQMMAATATK
jgi:anti-sigma28 factor (negative regulator of flagellin synthesis)